MNSGTSLTWIGYTDPNVPALELFSTQGQSLDKTLACLEGGIPKSLRFHVHLVLDNSDTDAIASREEVLDIADRSIEGEIAKVCRVGWLVWQR